MTGDTITVLRSKGPRLAKYIRHNGKIEGYDRARTFDIATVPVADLTALAAILRRLAGLADRAVIMGAVADPDRIRGVRRLLHDQPDAAATIRAVARWWLPLDIEGIPLPAALSPADLAGCADYALATLPAAFQGARCIVQASGSHGFLPDARLRFWFWCSRPVNGADAARWLRNTPADPSIFSPAQLIYTARPVFDVGIADPLPVRMIELPGRWALEVPPPPELTPPPREVRACAPAKTTGRRYADAALLAATDRISRAEKRHPVIIRESCGLGRLVALGMLDEALMRSAIKRAAEAVGKDNATEIDACIAWGLRHAGSAAHG